MTRSASAALGPMLALSLALVGCPRPPASPALPRLGPRSQALPELRTFSETQPVTAVAALGEHLYAGTPQGVVRFDERSGEFVRLTAREGLAGDHVYALSADADSGLWVATENGISRYRDGVWENFPPATPPGATVTAMVAAPWGVWAGGPQGLGRLRDKTWKGYLRGAVITLLIADTTPGAVWVGTDGEGVYRSRGDALESHSAARDQLVRRVEGMTLTSTGGLLAVGQDSEGALLSVYDGTRWIAFRVEPRVTFRWIQRVGDGVLLAHGDRVVALRQTSPRRTGDPVPRPGPLMLKAIPSDERPEGYPVPGFYTRPVEGQVPRGATVVARRRESVLVGTRHKGLARIRGGELSWYRTRDLVREGAKLLMACDRTGCYLPGGDGQGLRYREGAFERVAVSADPTGRVEAFVRHPSGGVRALYLQPDGRTLEIRRRTPEGFVVERTAALPVARGRLRLRFARYAPDGALWVGLWHLPEPRSPRRPFGAAVIRSAGPVVFHRSTLGPAEQRPGGSLALPDDIRDVMFAEGRAWIATGAGVCVVQGGSVSQITENDGLVSEIIHDIARTRDGVVLVATHGGLGRLDDGQWWFDFPAPLSGPSRSVLPDAAGLWVGTDKGLARRLGGELTVIDRDRGLAGDVVRDLHRAPSGRLWVLTDEGLSILPAGAGVLADP